MAELDAYFCTHEFLMPYTSRSRLWWQHILQTTAQLEFISTCPPRCRSLVTQWIAPLKPTKVTLITMILYTLENSIRDIRPFCRPLFCHSSVVKYTSSLAEAEPLWDLTT